mmetsp:Transcript_13381/g.21051  ORF Transcript_13381/g.21051 Transcript_13381/m.21051 type:complete len:225 (+) Transcript_13381:841-1515(+)
MSKPFDEGRFKITPMLPLSSSRRTKTTDLWNSWLSSKKGDRSADDALTSAPSMIGAAFSRLGSRMRLIRCLTSSGLTLNSSGFRSCLPAPPPAAADRRLLNAHSFIIKSSNPPETCLAISALPIMFINRDQVSSPASRGSDPSPWRASSLSKVCESVATIYHELLMSSPLSWPLPQPAYPTKTQKSLTSATPAFTNFLALSNVVHWISFMTGMLALVAFSSLME